MLEGNILCVYVCCLKEICAQRGMTTAVLPSQILIVKYTMVFKFANTKLLLPSRSEVLQYYRERE